MVIGFGANRIDDIHSGHHGVKVVGIEKNLVTNAAQVTTMPAAPATIAAKLTALVAAGLIYGHEWKQGVGPPREHRSFAKKLRHAYEKHFPTAHTPQNPMADSATPPLLGPDLLADGLALTALADGAMTIGHAHGEAVLLARRGDAIFAISAKFSHLGAPLGEGLLEGDTMRCPWHHACFCLRTGEALHAPALDPQPCWTVAQRAGRAYVTGKQERDPLAPVATAKTPAHPAAVVIVGAGAAGSAAAEMLRREGYKGRITVLDGEAEAPYDRTMLSKSFPADEKTPVALRPAGFYAEHKIDVVHGEVAALDVPGRRVLLANGAAHAYDALLLATGATPVSLDIPGHDLPQVHTLRSLADHRAIVAGAKGARRAVVLGASFIGLEVAAALRGLGIEVHVVAPDETPLAKVLGPELGTMVRKLHE